MDLITRHLTTAASAFARAPLQPTPLPDPDKSRTLLESKVISVDGIPATTGANGAQRWNVLEGVLATGEAIQVHESLQPAGAAPNPAHTIQHSELILVQEGTLLFQHDGKSEKVGAGGVILVVSGTNHAAKNVGDGPAKYMVIAIGGDTR